MYTVGKLSKTFGLARSTLLYYHRLGLLSPSGRSAANYRLYSDADVARLERILEFRAVGLPLQAIAPLLDAAAGSIAEVLEARLAQINAEIHQLRRQQQVILGLLQNKQAQQLTRSLSKQTWVELLRATGLDEQDMQRWHQQFEQAAPEAHQDFLEALGIDAEEITHIRHQARGAKAG